MINNFNEDPLRFIHLVQFVYKGKSGTFTAEIRPYGTE
jgi:hypothetical protein